MREARGNLWDLAQPGEALVITTNGFVKRNGEAVMGRGIALEAKTRFPGIERTLAGNIRAHGNHVSLISTTGFHADILTMPVKHNWWEEADPALIRRSAIELLAFADGDHWPRIWLPRPGCGNGRLNWSDIRPILAPILDDRFTVVTFLV